MEVVSELIENAMHSTTAGFVGVSLIFVYMAWIVGMAIMRIKHNLEHDHH